MKEPSIKKSKIDFVVTWLDDSDAVWRAEKDKHQLGVVSGSNSEDRYRDWGFLQYWFRSVEKNAPWVNKIYLVTCGQKPDWLDDSNPKVVLVDHKSYMPEQSLPTFNSNVIELYFHKIPGLSEKFVYFNDDTILNAPVNPSDFFEDGLPTDRFVFNAVSARAEGGIVEHTVLNDLELLSRDFSKTQVMKEQRSKIYSLKYGKGLMRTFLLRPWKYFTGIENPHSAQPLLKSSFDTVWKKYPDELNKNGLHKFRTKDDYSWWLVRYYQLFTGKFAPSSLNDRKFYDLQNDNKALLKDIKVGKHKVICINDSSEDFDFQKVRTSILNVFADRYKEKSSFEREA